MQNYRKIYIKMLNNSKIQSEVYSLILIICRVNSNKWIYSKMLNDVNIIRSK